MLWAGPGTNNAPKYYSAYITSKVAQIKMTELLDEEFDDLDITIPNIHPSSTHDPPTITPTPDLDDDFIVNVEILYDVDNTTNYLHDILPFTSNSNVPPMDNILLNHLAFNVSNTAYQRSMRQYIYNSSGYNQQIQENVNNMLTMEKDQYIELYNIHIPTKKIPLIH